VPAEFVGPALAELVAHEVGHTIGLRHNFKGSSAYELRRSTPRSSRARHPVERDGDGLQRHQHLHAGQRRGCRARPRATSARSHIGPYDYWVIEYGYTTATPRRSSSARASPALDYATDEDTWGPDPLARRYDLSKYPIDYARTRWSWSRHPRSLLDDFVEDGESWSRGPPGLRHRARAEHIKAVG
jgi:hypothetical protein